MRAWPPPAQHAFYAAQQLCGACRARSQHPRGISCSFPSAHACHSFSYQTTSHLRAHHFIHCSSNPFPRLPSHEPLVLSCHISCTHLLPTRPPLHTPTGLPHLPLPPVSRPELHVHLNPSSELPSVPVPTCTACCPRRGAAKPFVPHVVVRSRRGQAAEIGTGACLLVWAYSLYDRNGRSDTDPGAQWARCVGS